MDVRQLRYFLGVVDHKGFTRAAEALLVAQPSLSQSIRGLEKSVGAPLFHRVGRGVELTAAGEQLVGPARQVLRDLDAAQAAVDSTRTLSSGRLDLIAMPSPGVEPLTALLRDFHARYPGLSLNVDAAFTPEQVVQHVDSGSSEIGLLGAAGRPGTAALRVLHLEFQPLILISPPGTAVRGESVQPSELGGLDVVISQRGSLMRQLVDDALASGAPVNIVAEVAHRTSLLPLVQAGVGHTVMPESWRDTATAGGCVVHRIDPGEVLDIFLVARTSGLTPAAEAFIDMVESRYALPHS
ncbi:MULTISPECIES: LysR family transcriptional regulator [Kocuria]|uniref:LysR family transcriptional regulator n=1 Tax=Kocuria TaxID=57493 RepID=UPI0006D7938F|nr:MULTISPECIES: LysR family transcriptional regulator [Kocuria]MDN5632124.1 LysR family transcriptional regulator [Kocuria sp.]